jgi:hypothetical protein
LAGSKRFQASSTAQSRLAAAPRPQKAAARGRSALALRRAPPERSVGLGGYDRGLITPAVCAELPAPARAAGQPGHGEPAKRQRDALVAGSDGTEARWAGSGRCGGFAQSCGRRRSPDRSRPDLRSLHQQGSCGQFPCVSVHTDRSTRWLSLPRALARGGGRNYSKKYIRP